MAEFKIVIGTKEGKCFQKEIKDADAKVFLNKKLGDKVSGDECGYAGYEFEITGGSDKSGFPMRKDVRGPARKRILAVKGVGLKMKSKGIRIRKTVRGNTVTDQISQINLKVLKEGKEKLAAEKSSAEGEAPAEGAPAAPAAKAPKEAAPKAEEKPAEEKKEEAPKEEAPAEKPAEEKKEEKPAEEPKVEEKPAEAPADDKKE